jgi:hypothetical protein
MSKRERRSGEQVPQRLRRHILAPILRAEDLATAEREEVEAEIRAFRTFLDRLSDIEATRTATPTPATRSLSHAEAANTGERLRTAYEETVMSLAHFDRVYDESLAEHVARELSPQLLPVFDPGANAFTEVYRQTLRSAVEDSIADRERFVSVLEDEVAALDTARARLRSVLDSGGRPGTAGDRRDTIDELARDRQEALGLRPSLVQLDGHECCEYVYESECWTYPVLTAVARLRENVVE